MKWILRLQPLAAVVVMTVLVGALSVNQTFAAPTSTKQSVIQSVAVAGEDAAAELVVTMSAPVTYTSYKTTAPLRLVVDFSQAVPADALSSELTGKGAFKRVSVKRFDTDAGVLTRMEIELAQDIDGVITPSVDKQNILKISFPGYKPAAVTVAEAPPVSAPAVAPKDITPEVLGESTVTGIAGRGDLIQIFMAGAARDYRTFRLAKPDRVVIDIPGAKSAAELKIVQLNTAGIATARVGTTVDRVRIVLDAANADLPDARIAKNEAGLVVEFPAASVASRPAVAPLSVVDPLPVVAKADTKPVTVEKTMTPQIEAVDFQAFEKMSRVSVKVASSVIVDQPIKSAGFVSFKLLNTQVPKHLQRSYEAREFKSPVLRITPIQLRSKMGYDTVIRVAMRSEAEFQLRRESDMVYLEFKHAAVAPSVDISAATAAKSAAQEVTIEQQLSQPAIGGKRAYTGRKITLEFADAEVSKIFQLLSEVSNKNFVLGDEVTGNISLKLVNVPWDQAMDIILDSKGLDKREEGNIVLIRGKGKFKSLLEEELEVRKAALKSEPLGTEIFDVNYADIAGIVAQFNALKTERGVITSDARTNKIIVKDVLSALDDMRKMLANLDVPERQVMIEARIVEASTDFVHSLGVNWLSGTNPASSGSNFPFVQTQDTSFGGLAATAAALGVPGLNSDILFGTIGKNVQLQMRINAAASAGMVRIISTPKVATLNHKSAKITQGQQIPYTSATADKVETKFVEAALSLEVTPHINANGTIVMKIDAKNDAPGSTGNPPAINKKQATTEMLLRDGETTVIGGIYVDSETDGEQGVPWMKDIPLFGHLFKSTEIRKNRQELLIFITPRILNSTI